jgi:hypothetical protein
MENLLEGFNRRLGHTEEKTNKLEDRNYSIRNYSVRGTKRKVNE